ncbi:MAG: hypothetical protein KDA24_27095 [Deltaproteobacteria bacterium]|nr:hypothetical protein [Deltaproteobacteria bacterium]
MNRSIVTLAIAGALSLTALPAEAAVINGVNGQGALWQINVPDTGWNGDLVVYAHGIEEPGKALVVNPDGFPFEVLGSFGYATITSSYSSTGWAVKDAFSDVHDLQAVFQAEVGAANRVYMLGASLGSIVASQQAERFGSQYDGALYFCAPLNGLAYSEGYFAEISLLFDYFYPGVLGFDPANPPVYGTFDVGSMLLGVQYALLLDPLGALQILNVMGGDVAGTNLGEFAESIVSAIAFLATYGEEANDRANGWSFDTNTTVYAGSFDDAALNASIGRITSANRAVNFSNQWYTPDGDLHVPTVLLTTLHDPVVPFANAVDFTDLVDSQGKSSLFALETVDRFGHCAFSANEILGAFFDLVAWVEYGVPPAGGDVTNP